MACGEVVSGAAVLVESYHIIWQESLAKPAPQFRSPVSLWCAALRDMETWEEARITDIGVAATSKVWDILPDKVIFSNVNDFALKTRANINLRWRSLHAEWHLVLSGALRHCKLKGMRQAAEYHSNTVFPAGR